MIYSLDVLLFQFGNSSLFHYQFLLLLLYLHTGFLWSRKVNGKWPSKVAWYSHLFKIVSQFIVIQKVKIFTLVSEAEVNISLEFPCFFYDPQDVGNLTSCSSAFSKSNLSIWKFLVHVLLKSSLKDFKHYLASMWNKSNCVVVWIFFGIALLWDSNKNWSFPVLGPLLSFPNLLAYWVQDFNNITNLDLK